MNFTSYDFRLTNARIRRRTKSVTNRGGGAQVPSNQLTKPCPSSAAHSVDSIEPPSRVETAAARANEKSLALERAVRRTSELYNIHVYPGSQL